MVSQNTTLQINLSPGDVNYAALTVPALVKHHPAIENKLLIVDCCRPQKTKLIDPDLKFPLPVFQKNVERITAISEQLLKEGVVSDVYYLKPGDPLFKHLAKKYLNNVYATTHGAGGTANMSYWAGMELPQTQYVMHYDGDIILHQKNGYEWHQEAIQKLEANTDSIFAVPRVCPSYVENDIDVPSLHEGRPYQTFNDYWKNDWFSTRYFLFDKQKLTSFLPLVRGKLMAELLLRKYALRAFPLDPEIVMFRSIALRGGKRIILKNRDAWAIHPQNKPQEFINILPRLIKAVNEGKAPELQKGYEDIVLDEWIKYFEG